MSSYNATAFPDDPLFHTHPFYYSPAKSLVPWLSDPVLAAIAPLPAYWLTSALFHLFDLSSSKWLERHRIHDSAEVAARNLATRSQVFWAVLFQQALQTVLGLLWDATPQLAYAVYWWFIPTAQLLSPWSSWILAVLPPPRNAHKQVPLQAPPLGAPPAYVPYAYGALYNHPVEGFLLDSIGAVLGEAAAQLSVRQATFFFVISTCKTVDDHCGYRLPFDPLQLFSGNTADYHDIHHQVVGIKSNFSQPWFIHWDVILGTRMTRRDIEDRRAKVKSS
ncbi:hypothetical protein BC834DRAFT_840846 [Gloeopeniophorella convolvens]|nr:hypothetical protein BC834DRAFT_840846 [Gloeopeniophorella convolvens]